MSSEACSKRRMGDEYYCQRCRTRWDINDPEPPACDAEQQKPVTLTERLRALSKRLRDTAKDVPISRAITDDLDDMTEEVKLLDDERQRARANARGGAGENVTPLRRG